MDYPQYNPSFDNVDEEPNPSDSNSRFSVDTLHTFLTQGGSYGSALIENYNYVIHTSQTQPNDIPNTMRYADKREQAALAFTVEAILKEKPEYPIVVIDDLEDALRFVQLGIDSAQQINPLAGSNVVFVRVMGKNLTPTAIAQTAKNELQAKGVNDQTPFVVVDYNLRHGGIKGTDVASEFKRIWESEG